MSTATVATGTVTGRSWSNGRPVVKVTIARHPVHVTPLGHTMRGAS